MPSPFDHSFKILSDDDPRGLMAGFAGIPLDAPMTVTTLDSELNRPTLRVDRLYACERPGAAPFLMHFEAISQFRGETISKQLDYVQAIIDKHRMAVRSYMLLLRKDGVPASLPRWVEQDFGDQTRKTRLRAVRVWRYPARRLLELRRAVLYPWTVLSQARAEEISEAAARLWDGRYEEYFLQLQTLFGLRYGKDDPLVQEIKRMPVEEVLRDSVFYQDLMAHINKLVEDGRREASDSGLAEGRSQGLSQGLSQGTLAGRREALMVVARARFGGVPDWAVERIGAGDEPQLTAWLERAATAASIDAVFGQ